MGQVPGVVMVTGGSGNQKEMSFSDARHLHTMLPVLVFQSLLS